MVMQFPMYLSTTYRERGKCTERRGGRVNLGLPGTVCEGGRLRREFG